MEYRTFNKSLLHRAEIDQLLNKHAVVVQELRQEVNRANSPLKHRHRRAWSHSFDPTEMQVLSPSDISFSPSDSESDSDEEEPEAGTITDECERIGKVFSMAEVRAKLDRQKQMLTATWKKQRVRDQEKNRKIQNRLRSTMSLLEGMQ